MSGHTPGPWSAWFHEDDGRNSMSSCFAVVASGDLEIALLDVREYEESDDWDALHARHPIAEANANLMAAAPDLYSLLSGIRQMFRTDRDAMTAEEKATAGRMASMEDGQMAALIAKVLAKAEGVNQ